MSDSLRITGGLTAVASLSTAAGRATAGMIPPIAVQFCLRVVACLVQAIFVGAAAQAYLNDTSRVSIILLIISEAVTFFILILSRLPKTIDYHPTAFIMVVVAYCYLILLDHDNCVRLIPEHVAVMMQAVGMIWTIYAKLSIGRSFGLLPASRGLVDTGAYRWVRHPIYAGYLATHIGYLLANFGLRNLLVIMLLYVVQIMRILREESILTSSIDYRNYALRVRYRLIPGLF